MKIKNPKTGEVHQIGARRMPEKHEIFPDMRALSRSGTEPITLTLTRAEVTHFGFIVRGKAEKFVNEFMEYAKSSRLRWIFDDSRQVLKIFP